MIFETTSFCAHPPPQKILHNRSTQSLLPLPRRRRSTASLVRLANELVDEVLALSGLSTLDEGLDLPGSGSTKRVGELEGPKEVVDLLEAVEGVKRKRKVNNVFEYRASWFEIENALRSS